MRVFLIFAAIVSSLVCSVEVRAQEEATVELVAVGDILLDRGVAKRIGREGTGRVFADVEEEIAGADVAFGNLENPVASRCRWKAAKKISFQAQPATAYALSGAGFDLVSLANNHTLDCGKSGLWETIDHLKARGLRWVGAGPTPAAAAAPVVLNLKGIKIAFVAFTDIEPGPNMWAGVARASTFALRRAVTAARAAGANAVVVSLHWGTEYASRPGARQRELAQAAVEAGADLVLGHHTHTLQGLEAFAPQGHTTRRALVAYSLGNFVFDSPPSPVRRVVESVILRCRFSKDGLVSAEVRAVVLDRYLPRPAAPDESRNIFQRLAELSAELGTNLTGGRVDLR